MKFGKYFEEELAKLNLPQNWIDNAIQYKALKKRIKKFSYELGAIGLSKKTLKVLLDSANNEGETSSVKKETVASKTNAQYGDNIVRLESLDSDLSALSLDKEKPSQKDIKETDYKFNLNVEVEEIEDTGVRSKPMAEYVFQKDHHYTKPRLVIYLTSNDAYSKEIKQKLVQYKENKQRVEKISELTDDEVSSQTIEEKKLAKLKSENHLKITITLKEDDKFFQMIFLELESLQELKEDYRKEMIEKVGEVARTIGTVASPSKFRTDMDSWRDIFQIYLDNRIFFVSDDLHGERPVKDSDRRLIEFNNEVGSLQLVKNFKHRRSKTAFSSFYQINQELLNAMKFQDLNRIAVNKILKKFDKRTALAVKTEFPELLAQEPFITESFVTNIYAVIAEKLVTVVPQLEDYNCPICFSIAYKPIKLSCDHVFCVQCLINLQRQRKAQCPVCRTPSVLEADSRNLDIERMHYMEKQFPKQCKEKQKERLAQIEKETYAKVLSQYQNNNGCLIM